jgi:hypothetical protein
MSLGGGGGAFGFVDMFTGGAFSQMTVMALGVMPYISASIIMQILTVVIPNLETPLERGRIGPPQDQPDHTLLSYDPRRLPVDRHRRLPPSAERRRLLYGRPPRAVPPNHHDRHDHRVHHPDVDR